MSMQNGLRFHQMCGKVDELSWVIQWAKHPNTFFSPNYYHPRSSSCTFLCPRVLFCGFLPAAWIVGSDRSFWLCSSTGPIVFPTSQKKVYFQECPAVVDVSTVEDVRGWCVSASQLSTLLEKKAVALPLERLLFFFSFIAFISSFPFPSMLWLLSMLTTNLFFFPFYLVFDRNKSIWISPLHVVSTVGHQASACPKAGSPTW